MTLGIPSASPAVNYREIDLSGRIANIASSTGVIAGNFNWGPVDEPILTANEAGLVSTFGTPDNNNSVDFHQSVYFLRYSDNLMVVREVTSAARNSRANASADAPIVKNEEDFDNQTSALGDSDHTYIAKFPGSLGNSIEVQICPADSDHGTWNGWTYKDEFNEGPYTSVYAEDRNGTYDEAHVVVIDKTGEITGSVGTILEKYPFVSLATDAKNSNGTSNYAIDVINNKSEYVKMVGFDSDFTNTGAAGTALTPGTPKNYNGDSTLVATSFTFSGGVNSGSLGTSELAAAFDHFEDKETTTVDFLIAPGMTSNADQITVVADLAAIAGTQRKDCIVIASPPREAIIGSSTRVASSKTFADGLNASSYVFLDNNYLKVYDKYNDKMIWIPAASSTAGIMAASDKVSAPWYSPAGSRRGQYVGVQDVAYSPLKTDRDSLYRSSINAITNFPGEGIILYGDKTKLGRPSAFDRINVRRLFLSMERAIAKAARDVIFEFNDEFTRADFLGKVEPYLRDIKSRRGVTEYSVICDTTNNTPTVIDNNEFVASIFVDPAQSINNVTLNFVATRTGVSFEEVVGAV